MIATAAIIPTLPSNGKKPDAPGAEPVEQDVGVTRPDPAAPGLPAGPADEAFCKELAVLPPRKQEVVVEAKLKELNPDFHGVVSHTFFNPPIPIRFIGFSTDEVTNISPVRALPALVFLHCNGSAPGKGKLTDLSPLRGMKLVRLDITNNPVRDVSPLRDLPLETLWFDDRPDQDLTPLRKIKTLLKINTKPAAEFWAEHPPLKNNP